MPGKIFPQLEEDGMSHHEPAVPVAERLDLGPRGGCPSPSYLPERSGNVTPVYLSLVSGWHSASNA